MVIPTASLPLPRSLRDTVVAQFAPEEPARGECLRAEEIVNYLAQGKETDNSPLSSIRRRVARDGRREDISSEHMAVLSWVCEAFADWQEIYPLESPLREQIHRLLPLAVACALSDDSFFLVGAHPLHHLLDALQNGAVGWQARLERAGQMLEQRLHRSVDKALEWFGDRTLDLSLITRELQAANDRDVARAERMVQRLEETERAQIRTLEARRLVGDEFNTLLQNHPLPAAIGEFVRGPWFDSAQIVVVKFGAQSPEWGDMRRTTRQLLESVQPAGEPREIDHERRDQILRRLPAELRRWLLSLQHDSVATDSAVGLVEYSHLRMQHGQQLQLERVPPIPMDGDEESPAEQQRDTTAVGDWYRFEDEQGGLRAQLVLKLDRGRHLVFANFVGLKALSLSHGEFQQQLSKGKAQHLASTGTFSCTLAASAGIDGVEELGLFLNPESDDSDDTHSATATASAQEAGTDGATPAPAAPAEALIAHPPEHPATWAAPTPTPVAPVAPPPPDPPPPLDPPSASPTSDPPAPTQPVQPRPPPTPAETAPLAPAAQPAGGGRRELDVPMGAWLGFHDGEMPMMAKLAVYDPRRDNYIFVNRKGIALRELSSGELGALIDEDLVDILEMRSYFRDEVRRARGEQS